MRKALCSWSVIYTSCSYVLTTYLQTEIAFIGKAPGTYLMLLGGGYYGQRLNKIYRGMKTHVVP